VPATATSPNFDHSQLNGSQIFWGQPGFGRSGENQMWSLMVQTNLATDLMLTTGYMGEAGSHLASNLAFVNDLNPHYFALGAHLNDTFTKSTAILDGVAAPYTGFTGTVAQALRPYPQYTYINTSSYGENIGHNSFHAMIVKLERRYHNGLNLLASYTWSKNIANVGGVAAGSLGASFVPTVQNPFNRKTEKAIAQEDVPSIFVVSYVYDLPFGRGKKFLSSSRAADYAVGGWSLTGIQRYQAGNPVSFGCATSIPGMFVNQEGVVHCVRWNLVAGQHIHSTALSQGSFNPAIAGHNQWYNAGAFSDPNANVTGSQPYSYGNKPAFQGNDRATNFYDEAWGLVKSIPITEKIRGVFRAELFNAFNRHIFGYPDSGPYDGSAFGTVTTLRNSPRTAQFEFRAQF
jgi:hypothetical protein